MEELMKHS